jgi:hypothetical protein
MMASMVTSQAGSVKIRVPGRGQVLGGLVAEGRGLIAEGCGLTQKDRTQSD